LSDVVAAGRRLGALSRSGALCLLAVVAVLVVVSLPRLRGMALQENEVDARATAQILGRALRELEARAARDPQLHELIGLPELRGLADVELLAEGAVLRRHGYLFEVTRLPPALAARAASAGAVQGETGSAGSVLAIHAWPWELGTTGFVSFLLTPTGGELLLPGSAAVREGLRGAGGTLSALEGWRSGS
jgi:hypothetical protein